MNALETWIGPWVLRYRIPIILITLLVTGVALLGTRSLSFTTNYRVFFSADNPQLLAFEALEKTYSKNDNLLIVLTPRDTEVFSTPVLEVLRELTERAWQVPFSTRVDSITNFQYSRAQGDELIVGDLVESVENLSVDDLAKIRDIALQEPLLLGKLIARDTRVTGVNITIQLPGKDPGAENPHVMQFARELVADFAERYPGIEFRMTGMVPMNHAFTEASLQDMSTLIPLSFLLMLVFLGVLLRSLVGTLITLVVILLSIMIAMGTGGWIGFPITPPSATAPTIILTMAIASSVHLLVTYSHELARGKDRPSALSESLRVNLQPIFLASATTLLGFLSMNFSEVPPFQHLGNFVAIGVAASFLLVIFFMPAVLSFLPMRPRVHMGRQDPWMQKFSHFVIARRNFLVWGMAGLIVVLVAFIPRNELNDVFVQYFAPDIPFRADTDYATEHLTGTYIIDYSLDSGNTGGISDPVFLREVEAFAAWYREQPETLHVNTLTDIMKRLNRNMHADEAGFYRLPDNRELAAQYLLLYEMSLPYGLDLNNQINVNKSSLRFTVTTKNLSTNTLLTLEARAQEWLAQNARQIRPTEGSGTTMMFAHIGKRNIISMLLGTTLALIMISLLLVIAFRSVSFGLLSMVPNLVPAAMGFGIWGIFVGQVGLALSVVTTMTLGIIVDDTVHFMSKYLRARREHQLDAAASVQYAFNTVGRALLITSLVLIVGFLVLVLSSFELNSGMGLLTAIVIALALLADFLFLPSLLMKLEDRKRESNTAVPDTSVAS